MGGSRERLPLKRGHVRGCVLGWRAGEVNA